MGGDFDSHHIGRNHAQPTPGRADIRGAGELEQFPIDGRPDALGVHGKALHQMRVFRQDHRGEHRRRGRKIAVGGRHLPEKRPGESNQDGSRPGSRASAHPGQETSSPSDACTYNPESPAISSGQQQEPAAGAGKPRRCTSRRFGNRRTRSPGLATSSSPRCAHREFDHPAR